MTAGLSWNLIDDIRQLLSFHFMLNALRAGTIVAVVAGAIGYLMVLRRQSFAGHTRETVRIWGRVNRPSARWFFGGARCGFRRRWWYRVDRRIAGPFGRWRGPGGVGWFPARLRR
jgi:hypothetical protein